MSYPNAVLPQGSLVLVSGVTGLCASVIARELLAAGYKVRGTTRTAEKAQSLKDQFDQKFGAGKFEVVEVRDVAAAGAFDVALNGAAGLIHVATDTSGNTDPEVVVNGAINLALNVLRSAAKTPSIRRVVMTSSSLAAYTPQPGQTLEVDEGLLWNDQQYKMAWEIPKDHPFKPMAVYAASKIASEKAVWKYIKDEKPSFDFNVVLPNLIVGEILIGEGSSSGWVRSAFINRDLTPIAAVVSPVGSYVGVTDTARIHIGALLDGDIKGQRVWASAGDFELDTILKVFNKHYGPGKEFSPEVKVEPFTLKLHQPRSFEILKKFGRDGYAPFEEVLELCLEGAVPKQ